MSEYIRNFCIIAHIDHGKSTLADRLLEFTKTVSDQEKKDQLLDDMEVERERGITIKSHAIQMTYAYRGKTYILNLIDTPGHADFSYEVSRSIYSCEGALLVVDASQSIQAQTISNLYLALENNLTIIPVLNKIDLPGSRTYEVIDDVIELTYCHPKEIIFASAKKGLGIEEILQAIITRIPPPNGSPFEPLQAFIFDSNYNPFKGIEIYFRIIHGHLVKGQKLKFLASGLTYSANEIGILKFKKISKECIQTGDVGYVISGIKEAKDVKVGDTFTSSENPAIFPLKKFVESKPMIFSGIYPLHNKDYEELRTSMEKLRLNDASLSFVSETSTVLGFGFRCGLLGMLHMEIVKERLEKEYNMTVIITIPNVSYHVFLKKNTEKAIIVKNPSDFPDLSKLDRVEEPYIRAEIITMYDYVGSIISLCLEKRGVIKNQLHLTLHSVKLVFEMPLSEVVFDFYDRLKKLTKGYASFDYTLLEYRPSNLVKIDILINHQVFDSLSFLSTLNNSFKMGKKICEKLRELIPRHQFDIPIQATLGSKILARETIKSFRKDVTAKCYGGDISRKRKLLEQQKLGKKKMRNIGKIEIPQSAFIEIFKFLN